MTPSNIVEIKSDEYFIVYLMYATTHNMVQMNAYEQVKLGHRCFMHQDAYDKLMSLRPVLKQKRMKLKIFDAYRPPLAHELMKNKIPVKGLYAESAFLSQHCHASAVDVALTDSNGTELDFPTKVDAYSPEYAQQLAEGKCRPYQEHLKKACYAYENPLEKQKMANRTLLRHMMENAGFEALHQEWWHFNLPCKEKYPMLEFNSDTCTFVPAAEPRL